MSINSFTYNGVSSESLGLYVGGQQTFGSPQRDVTKVSIPGRNGDLIRDNGRFLNAQIAYNVVAMSDFKSKAQSVRNWLMSAKGYKRLEDTYHPEHYRMARVADSVDFETGAFNATGKAKIIFDCMPQRFLKSGETAISGDPVERSASGEIASFETDYVVPLTSAAVSLSPIQSLNGYDHPWPGGGGKNKLPPLSAPSTMNGVTFTPQSDGSVKCTGTANGFAYCTFPVVSLPAGSYALSGASGWGTGATPLKRVILLKSGITVAADYGNGATFNLTETTEITARIDFGSGATTEVTAWPMIRAAGTDASFSPYSNICPISGHTGAELNIAKHNIWNEQWRNGSIDIANGTVVGGNNVISNDYILVTPNTAYYATQRIRVFFYDANKAFLSFVDIDHTSFTTPSECRYILFTAFLAYGTAYNNDISINYPATDHEYHAYEGNTYSVTFTDQGTVYGGTYDFVTGNLNVTYRGIDLSTLSGWSKYANIDGTVNINISGLGMAVPAHTGIPSSDSIICSHFKNNSRSAIAGKTDIGIGIGSATIAVFYAGEHSATVSDWTTYLAAQTAAGTPVMIVAKLATPLEYTLSPQQIETLLGENNVWSDAWEISLTFYEPAELDNPTPFDSKPLIRVYGSGNGQVIIGNQIIALTNIDGYIDIDCETMNCYNGVENCNSKVKLGAQGFPTLPPGITAVSFGGGVTKVEITPRWWEL